MLLHLLQTSDRRQIFGHLRACGKGCGGKKSILIFVSWLCLHADSECAKFTVVGLREKVVEVALENYDPDFDHDSDLSPIVLRSL